MCSVLKTTFLREYSYQLKAIVTYVHYIQQCTPINRTINADASSDGNLKKLENKTWIGCFPV